MTVRAHRRLAVLAACAALGLPTRALAEPALWPTREPRPRHLRMRPVAVAAQPAPAPPPPARRPSPIPAAPPQLAELAATPEDELAALRDVREPVSFSLTLGYQVDGALPSGKASLNAPVQEGRDYNALRSYGFGELYLSTRGVALDSLSSYFALRLDIAKRDTPQPGASPDATPIAPPIATWVERTTLQVRTGWGEMKDFLPRRFGLQKLRLRAGNQYIYGPWVLHIDGLLLSYEGDTVTATGYAGGRRTDYTPDLTADRYAVAGASLRVDLRRLVALPLTLSGDTLSMQSFVAGQPDSAHNQLELSWQPRTDFTAFAQLRWQGSKLASQRLQFRARYRQVTNLVFDVVQRYDSDWRWDPSLIVADDPTAARRYLDLGPVLPQLIASLRGGTLIAENVDLFARTAVAVDLTEGNQTESSFSPTYFEIGGALELRLRRTIGVGISALARQTTREDLSEGRVIDDRFTPQPLPENAATGETDFSEIGARLRLSLGARRFSAMVEAYRRLTHYAELYEDPVNPIRTNDTRGGGRVSVDAWIGKRLRLFASYDLSSALDFMPEIVSYKSVRLTITGVY